MISFIATAFFFLQCLPTALLDFAIPKWKADQSIRIEDSYKYLYQATLGGEHAVPDRESARQWLDGEWASLGEAEPKDPIWEPLCPGGEIGRVNLRPLKNAEARTDDILTAFLDSSREYKGESATFILAWQELGRRLANTGVGSLTVNDWTRLDGEMKAKDYPAIHHSEAYNQARHPAYRVVTEAQMVMLLARTPKTRHN